MRRHVTFARQAALRFQHGRLVIEAGHGAVGKHVAKHAAPVRQRRARARLEQVIPQFVLVAAAGARGQGVQIAAVGQVALGHQAARIGIVRIRRVRARLPRQVDEGQLRLHGRPLAQRHPFRAVIAKREKRRCRACALCACRLRLAQQRHGRARAFVQQQGQHVRVAFRPFDQHGGRAQFAQHGLQCVGARRAVVAYRRKVHAMFEQPGARGSHAGRQIRLHIRLHYSHSWRAASPKLFHKSSRRPRSRTTVSK